MLLIYSIPSIPHTNELLISKLVLQSISPKLDALTFFVECIAQQSTGLQASCLRILGNLGRSGERREPSLGIVIVWQKNVASFPRNTCNVYTTFSDSGNLCERLIGQNIKMFVPCCPFCCSETYSKFIGKKGRRDIQCVGFSKAPVFSRIAVAAIRHF